MIIGYDIRSWIDKDKDAFYSAAPFSAPASDEKFGLFSDALISHYHLDGDDDLRLSCGFQYFNSFPTHWLTSDFSDDEVAFAFIRSARYLDVRDISWILSNRVEVCSGDQLHNAGFVSLGYDVCDSVLCSSLLFTCGEIERDRTLSIIGPPSVLNEYGLIDSLSDAEEVTIYANSISTDVDLFPIEVLMKSSEARKQE